MKTKLADPELPPNFGNDEISKQMKRNAESFETWWQRNRPLHDWQGLARVSLGPRVEAIARAAFNRKDL